MSESLKELRALSDEELIENHDNVAKHTQVGVDHYLREIARRDQDGQTRAMLGYTKWITILTIVITILTVINVIIAGSLLKG